MSGSGYCLRLGVRIVAQPMLRLAENIAVRDSDTDGAVVAVHVAVPALCGQPSCFHLHYSYTVPAASSVRIESKPLPPPPSNDELAAEAAWEAENNPSDSDSD